MASTKAPWGKAIQVHLKGFNKLMNKLRYRAATMKRQGVVAVAAVGYTTSYAGYVHENLQAHHPIGMAKYLEYPARAMIPELTAVAREKFKKGATVGAAILEAALLLQRMSQKLVPVDTGALRASAFTRLEREK